MRVGADSTRISTVVSERVEELTHLLVELQHT